MEQYAQAYFESNNSPENFYRFYSQLSFLLDDATVGFLATLRFDQKQKIFFLFFNTPIEETFGLKFPIFNEQKDLIGYLLFSNF